MRFLELIIAAFVAVEPLVFGRPQVAINPVPSVGSSPTNPDRQTDSSLTSSTGNYFDAPVLILRPVSTGNHFDHSVLTTSIGTDPIHLQSSTDQLENGQSQTNRFLTDLLTAYKTPAGQPPIDQSASNPFLIDQPEIDRVATYQLASGVSDSVSGLSDIPSVVPSQLSLYDEQGFEPPPVNEPPIGVTEEVTASFKSLTTKKCSFAIYGVSDNKVFLELKQCGDSKKAVDFSEQVVAHEPCLGVRRTRRKGHILSVLYYETESRDFKLLQYGRPDFEAGLRAETHYAISQETAQSKAILRQILGLRE
ncbi:hypothetical protein MMC29_005756 [Sticta canariensis]|nr:hypothetical protein [Sticta canariensis]